MRRTASGTPIFYDTDKLIKHVKENNDTMDNDDQPNNSTEWDYRDTDLYEHAWQNQGGSDLWIEDVTKILSDTPQTHLTDFKDDRYRVLEQEFYQPEGRLQDTFDDMDDALEYVEDNYEIEIG